MITPRFELSQTENTFTVTIRAPYCSLKELDTSVEHDTFLFYCKPYHLRLHLPGHIVENSHSSSSFDSDNGTFTFTYDKSVPGEHFENLEFITKFLVPKVEVQEGARKIEILSSTSEIPEETIECEHKYGFAQRGGYNFNYISSEFNDVFDLNPFEVPLEKRNELCRENESKQFNFDHYLADLMEPDVIEDLINNSPCPWHNLDSINFTPEELDYLKDLHNVKFNLTDKQIVWAMNGLVDILFAFCYDGRSTYFEGTCESGWTISKISTTLSSFNCFETPKDAIISAIRRSLVYPLYRSFDFCQKLLEDLREILKLGEKYLIKVLIKLHNVFLGGNCPRYILNHLFIKDYIIYIMNWDSEKWKTVVDQVNNLNIEQEELGLPLVDLKTQDEQSLEQLMQSLALHKEEGEVEEEEDDESIDSDDTGYDWNDTFSEESNSDYYSG